MTRNIRIGIQEHTLSISNINRYQIDCQKPQANLVPNEHNTKSCPNEQTRFNISCFSLQHSRYDLEIKRINLTRTKLGLVIRLKEGGKTVKKKRIAHFIHNCISEGQNYQQKLHVSNSIKGENIHTDKNSIENRNSQVLCQNRNFYTKNRYA